MFLFVFGFFALFCFEVGSLLILAILPCLCVQNAGFKGAHNHTSNYLLFLILALILFTSQDVVTETLARLCKFWKTAVAHPVSMTLGIGKVDLSLGMSPNKNSACQ